MGYQPVICSLIIGMAVSSGARGAALPDLQQNQTPIHTPLNRAAVALIPPGYHFARPGELTVAISAQNSPPLALLADDNQTRIGSDPDIARLLADSLGLKLNLVPVSWENWPLGISSGRYDVALVNIAVTEQRKQKYDFASYRTDSLAFSVRKNSPITRISKAKDIAGLKVVVGSGTNQERILLGWNQQNINRHLPPATPVYLTDDAADNLALLSGRVDVIFGPQAAATYKAALTGQTRVAGTGPVQAVVAATTQKGNKLVFAVQEALNGALRNGTYQQVMNRWGLQDEEITHSQVNPPGITY